ncbi:hypothetical protein [Legionella cardiaca]|uniref:Coiled-coil protein n=1 Tax=Legionella cardiaca TaxID=1071983 RepID=A0ABY8ASQ6_9GAMM|nr:hypothetical protein [Legionella cardiaca]WED42202.1 hypothetical protein PXX05_09695 [Legionella cardiaca]
MTKKLAYLEYYSRQMNFIHRFIKNEPQPEDQARLMRIKQLQAQQSISFLDEFLDIEEDKALETTRIGYKPLKSAHYTSEELAFFAPEADKIKPANRRLSRYRLVYGPVDFYLGSQLEVPTTIPVITACAPNLMGTSQADLDEFSTGGVSNRQLKVIPYENECKKIADFIVGNAKKSGQERLIMPSFGIGVYIKTLDFASKTKAREIMYKAFAEAAIRHQMKIDWIVWAGDHDAAITEQKFKNFSQNNPFIEPIVHEDMMLYAQERQQVHHEEVILLNPGSDRTVGGFYTHENPKTLEEQMAQQSDLVFLHSEFNQPMVKKFQLEFSQRKKLRQGTASSKDAVTENVSPSHTLDLKSIAEKINDHLNIKETTWISAQKNNFKISFKKQQDAQRFSQLLKANGIVDRYGMPLTITQDRQYHVLYLTKKQLMQVPSLDAKKEFTTDTNATVNLGTIAKTHIGERLKMQETPWIFLSQGNYKISFKNENTANKFKDILTANGIVGRHGMTKTVQKENQYHVIYLTAKQWQQIPTLEIPPESSFKKSAEELSPQVDLGTIAKTHIQGRLKLQETPWVFLSQGNYKISFKDKNTANRFKDILTANGIVGKHGVTKTVQKDNQYHVIYLTAKQWQQIPTLEIPPESSFKKSAEEPSPQVDVRSLAAQINNHLKIKETTWISQVGENYKISFKKEDAAQNFSQLLSDNDIKGRGGKPKAVQKDSNYYVVFLTARQLSQVPSLKVTEAKTSTRATKIDLKDTAQKIASHLELSETPWLFPQGQNYKVSFKSKDAADQFSRGLLAKGITARDRKAKTVRADNNFYVVYLTSKQLENISTKNTSTLKETTAHATENQINEIVRAIGEGITKSEKQEILLREIKRRNLPVAELSELYDVVKNINDLNTHRNPRLDSFFGIKNTASWRATVEEFRKLALNTLFSEINASDTHTQLEILGKAKNLPLFYEHRNNSIFTGAWGRTSAIKAIEEKEAELIEGSKLSIN